MSKPVVDPKRDGVKATLIPKWEEPPLEVIDGRWYGPPGAMIPREGNDGTGHLICCPGCGHLFATDGWYMETNYPFWESAKLGSEIASHGWRKPVE